MAQQEEIIINVGIDTGEVIDELSAVNKKVAELKQEQSELTKEIKAGNDANGENSKKLTQVQKDLNANIAVQKALTGQLQATEKANKQLGDSFYEMDAAVRQLEKQYKSLTKEQRETAEGVQLRDAIIAQKQALKDFDAELGNHQRNVGNYKSALEGVAGSFGSLGSKMKAFFANPWVAIIGAITLAIKALVDAFKASEERTEALEAAFAPLQGAVDLLKKGFSALANTIGTILVGALDAALKGVQWIAKQLDKLGEKFGKNWGLTEAFEKAAEATRTLTAAEQAYQQHHRKFVEEEAKNEREIARLKNEVAQKDKYTADERLKRLEEVGRRERYLAAERKKLAEEELRILELDAARGDNDAETNDKLAEAKAKVIRADTNYYDVAKKTEAAMAALRLEIEKETAATQTQADVTEQAAEKNVEATNKWYKSREDALRKFGLLAEQTAEEKELAVLQETHAQMLINDEEYEQAATMIHAKYLQQRDEATRASVEHATQLYQDNIAAGASAAGAALSTLSDLFGEYAEQSEEAAAAQKGLALGSVLLNEAISVAEGAKAIAAAQAGAAAAAAAGGPAAPILMAAYSASMVGQVLSTIASVAATIVQAKEILTAGSKNKFAHGGVVGGNSYEGDRVPIMANSNEVMLTPKQAATTLYKIANAPLTNGTYEMMTAAMAAALKQMPAPVMVYSEFENFTQNTATIKELATI